VESNKQQLTADNTFKIVPVFWSKHIMGLFVVIFEQSTEVTPEKKYILSKVVYLRFNLKERLKNLLA
jgi:hypothetical protein